MKLRRFPAMHISRRAGWILVAAAASALGPTHAAEPTPTRDGAKPEQASREEVRQLVDQLGDKKFAVRERATKRLIEIGQPALPAVREALRSNELEVRTRARRIADEIVSRQPDRKAREAVDRYLAGLRGGQAAQ